MELSSGREGAKQIQIHELPLLLLGQAVRWVYCCAGLHCKKRSRVKAEHKAIKPAIGNSLSLSLSLLPAYPVNHHLLMPVYFLAVYAAACYLFARRSRPSWPTLKSNFNDQCTRLHIRLAYMPIINNARCHAHPPQPFSARPCVDINEL